MGADTSQHLARAAACGEHVLLDRVRQVSEGQHGVGDGARSPSRPPFTSSVHTCRHRHSIAVRGKASTAARHGCGVATASAYCCVGWREARVRRPMGRPADQKSASLYRSVQPSRQASSDTAPHTNTTRGVNHASTWSADPRRRGLTLTIAASSWRNSRRRPHSTQPHAVPSTMVRNAGTLRMMMFHSSGEMAGGAAHPIPNPRHIREPSTTRHG